MAINAFNDNYIWAITNDESNYLALVDPGDACVCIDFIEKNQHTLCAILITHHHHDHVGGIKDLLNYAQQKSITVRVYGPTNKAIENISHPLKEHDNVELSELNVSLSVIELPGHTLDHIAYFNDELLFCGDTLFSGGCGRLFEGTSQQMHHSLTKLTQLADNTLIYCAHEYTQANLAFALAVEPKNKDLQQYHHDVITLRAKNVSTIPSTIGLEKRINPFLRSHSAEIKSSADQFNHTLHENDIAVFTTIRQWKNNF
jgi:hydroxyacylglutathione hydrolase